MWKLVFAFAVYDEFIGLVEKVRPSLAEKLPRHKEALHATSSVGKLVRVLRDFFEHAPQDAEKMLAEIQRSQALSVDARKQRILTSLIRMYQSGKSQYLNFYGPPGTLPTIPYYQVLQLQEHADGNSASLDVRGKAVFVGVSESFRPELKDGFHTVFSQPNGADISGVEIAATAFANLLEDMPMRPLGWGGHLATIFLWGLLLGVLCRLLSPIVAAGSVVELGLLYLSAAQYQFATTGSWYPLMVPVFLQIPLAYFGAVLWKYVDTNRERRNIREAFGYYVPDTVIDQLTESVAHVKTSSQLV